MLKSNDNDETVDIRDVINIDFEEESSVHSSEWDLSEWDRAEERY